ncbi:MAG: DNA replication and repair protein RecF [Candidatus Pacebacteria bacterium]|nr:DNA replication and repair protein RecF [Candidatus Paceibacterota bacterium]
MLSRLKLRHFRNYEALDVSFDNGLTVLTGENGQGKSNLLEAIHYLSLLRSFRTRRISDLCHWDRSYFFLEGLLRETPGTSLSRRMSVTYAGERRLKIDGMRIRRASEFINTFLCVAFVPEDIQLIHGPPAERRRFTDIVLSQGKAEYLAQRIQYRVAIKARNTAIRQSAKYGSKTVNAFSHAVAHHGAYITAARKSFIEHFNTLLERRAPQLFSDGHTVRCEYSSNALRHLTGSVSQAAIQETLEELLDKEIKYAKNGDERTTRAGPHRDDIILYLDDRRVDVFGSEGQARLMSLLMRLASIDILEELSDDRPIVALVDDVLGELDIVRRAAFMKTIATVGQVFLAATEIPEEVKNRTSQVFRITAGDLV